MGIKPYVDATITDTWNNGIVSDARKVVIEGHGAKFHGMLIISPDGFNAAIRNGGSRHQTCSKTGC
jgi:hypothetical protein